MFVPRIHPRSFKTCIKAETWTAASGSFSAMFMSTPIRSVCSGCCAPTESGQTVAAPATALMKSRRRIANPRGSKQGIVAGQTSRLEVVKMALSMSALCQKRTQAAQQLGSLLDYVVRDAEQRRRQREPEHPSGRAIDNQLKLARLHYGEVRGFSAPEDATGIDAKVTIRIPSARTVTHQPADFGMFTVLINGGYRVTCR